MNEILPVMAIPVVRTPALAAALAHYRDVLGFTVAQQVPGVVALLRHGAVRVQLWQHATPLRNANCRVALDAAGVDVFECHARLARHARGALDGAPSLKPWGAWEFVLTDGDGNRLVFVQWALDRVLELPETSMPAQQPSPRWSVDGTAPVRRRAP